MNNSLPEICAQLSDSGYRRLLVLSGESRWIENRLDYIQSDISGDWLTLSTTLTGAIPANKAHLLLGREFLHAIFDAREGFHSEALAMLAGTLKAGSLLILCTPPQSLWAQQPDTDSARWNEQHGIIPTPNFVHHLQRIIQAQSDVLVWQQNHNPQFSLMPAPPYWQPPTGMATVAQQHALNQLLSAKKGVWGVIAPRGRGKSTLAGMLVKQWQGECWCSAPAKAATEILERHVGQPITFWAPDELLRHCKNGGEVTADWLIIDEAAVIPTYILRQMIDYFPRVLLTTTVDGYEGTGRGFVNKFCAQLNDFTAIDLIEPIRWAVNDPLENWLNQALLLQEPEMVNDNHTSWQVLPVTQLTLVNDPIQLNDFYGLLTSAHYRTSPLDLRRLLDASRQQFMMVKSASQLIGALWMVEEGELDNTLSWQIWAGIRRPRGNLVVQSLAAHSYFPLASQMKSLRTMRIAVGAAHRRQKAGLQLLEAQKQQAASLEMDFVSVSFGLTPELLRFWQKAGYRLIRVGSHLEASSGCYTGMAILPLSVQAKRLCERAEQLLSRDLFWRCDLDEFNLNSSNEQNLTDEDLVELIGFGFYRRALASSSASIQRFLVKSEDDLISLRLYFQQKLSLTEICQQLKLTGHKQWLKQARGEICDIMQRDHPELAIKIEQKVNASYP
ncbi:tRNA(Met) cytidine acetyltransferase TmcA [Providencia burhodogranariea]|uniref:tRNA(Met) cytidine acetyltransferase TmcA n=1 Tax=Providencia burhodogranariea DSM 19968 TaxID=1141662 RepID=K8WUK0_9GAMM|nr:GNAT family N-acetyltransferase [Providencia burhodogranariea]EKT63611.1 methionine tRNA cytidine acetyltransferase [Providencia burhodogranariea DSM 19968]